MNNQFVYLGVDIAGADNTWVAGLARTADGLAIVLPPGQMTLAEILAYCRREPVLAVAIDGQLSMSTDDERGFRDSDHALRALLPPQNRNWVASFNSLMAVPMRSLLLAERLAPEVGTLLEVHPRASLWFALGADRPDAVRHYKKHPDAAVHVATLWAGWAERFAIQGQAPSTDGGLDALVCATLGYLYGQQPESLLHLRHPAPHKSGFGPFVVLR
jgi:predicted nuclease with RNAse H fold